MYRGHTTMGIEGYRNSEGISFREKFQEPTVKQHTRALSKHKKQTPGITQKTNRWCYLQRRRIDCKKTDLKDLFESLKPHLIRNRRKLRNIDVEGISEATIQAAIELSSGGLLSIENPTTDSGRVLRQILSCQQSLTDTRRKRLAVQGDCEGVT